eukprot:TRINITY_DN6351_c0_g1_i11.p1 TRINITY_DN6351_c0_g1~~TRINITY_DN6351_c0_g1_i11.p1  ORF type:complete len:238 (+),score=3.96 TRINITY_DN6351_c0_g1_i11:221-934(+)
MPKVRGGEGPHGHAALPGPCWLSYAVVSRPYISYIVSVLSQLLENSEQPHWEAGVRVLQYIKLTLNAHLRYHSEDGGLFEPFGYCAAGHAGDPYDRRSYSGHLFRIYGAAISWRAKKQSGIATTTAGGEYVECTNAAKEAMYLRNLFAELRLTKSALTLIFCDSTCANAMVSSPVYTNKTKAIEVQYHYAKDQQEKGFVHFAKVPSAENGADGFTKPLPIDKVAMCSQILGLVYTSV